MMFADEVTGEMFAINSVEHAVVLVSRMDELPRQTQFVVCER